LIPDALSLIGIKKLLIIMSKTLENLLAAFAGESQARNKYTFFAEVARKEGYHYIAEIFEATANNEKRHAKDEFKAAGKLGDTVSNLKAAIEGEDYEVTDMYPEFARIAREEGEMKVAILFEQIAKVEAHHRDRYKKLLEMLENGTLYEREEDIEWECGVCGYVHKGKNPPKICPCCKHPEGHFKPETI
jgi:rubrerythrin